MNFGEPKMPEKSKENDNEPETKSINDLLNYENPNAEQYKKLIKIVENEWKNKSGKSRSLLKRKYATRWEDLYFLEREDDEEVRKMFDYLEEKLQDDIVIDLGGMSMDLISEELGVRQIISVDKYVDLESWDYDEESETVSLGGQGNEYVGHTRNKSGTEEVLVTADMLDLVSNIESDSVNITMNGIDRLVVEDLDYHQALADEIRRVVKPGGVAFGRGAIPLEEIGEKGFKEKEFMEHKGTFKILEKLS